MDEGPQEKECRYCGMSHPAEAEYCPLTGEPLLHQSVSGCNAPGFESWLKSANSVQRVSLWFIPLFLWGIGLFFILRACSMAQAIPIASQVEETPLVEATPIEMTLVTKTSLEEERVRPTVSPPLTLLDLTHVAQTATVEAIVTSIALTIAPVTSPSPTLPARSKWVIRDWPRLGILSMLVFLWIMLAGWLYLFLSRRWD